MIWHVRDIVLTSNFSRHRHAPTPCRHAPLLCFICWFDLLRHHTLVRRNISEACQKIPFHSPFAIPSIHALSETLVVHPLRSNLICKQILVHIGAVVLRMENCSSSHSVERPIPEMACANNFAASENTELSLRHKKCPAAPLLRPLKVEPELNEDMPYFVLPPSIYEAQEN